MRILVLGAPFLNHGFRSLGHEVFNPGDKEECDLHCRHPLSALKIFERAQSLGFVADMALYCDSGNIPQFFDMEKLPCPSVFYSIDSYCNPWHVPLGHAFDLVFVAQKDYVGLFVASGVRAEWLPLFVRSDRPHLLESARDMDVSFVGTVGAANNPGRKPFLDAFGACRPLFVGRGDYVLPFNRSRIVLNQTAALEVNFRCFEAPACGAALLMEECDNGLRELFTPGEDILPTYRRADALEAAATAAAFLRAPSLLARIARQGRELVERRHRDTHRAAAIVDAVLPLLRGKAHEQRLLPENFSRRSLLLANAYFFLFSELQGPEFAPHRDFFLRLARHPAQSA